MVEEVATVAEEDTVVVAAAAVVIAVVVVVVVADAAKVDSANGAGIIDRSRSCTRLALKTRRKPRRVFCVPPRSTSTDHLTSVRSRRWVETIQQRTATGSKSSNRANAARYLSI